MKLTISKSKNAESLYISKSVRVNKHKTTTKTIKKLGTMESLLPEHDNDRDKVIAWAKDLAKKMTEEEKNNNLKISVDFSESTRLEKGKNISFNIGYLVLQKILYRLKIDSICKSISLDNKIDYDLEDIFTKLIYARVLEPCSKISSYKFAEKLLEGPKFDIHSIYRALDLIGNNSDKIQSLLYEYSSNVIKRNDKILYYDCTNYFFEINKEDELRKYGKSKEHRPNPIIHMGLLMDGSGYPLAFTIFPGNRNEQTTLKPLEKRIIKDFNLSKFIMCTDAGLSSYENREFNSFSERSYIVTQSIKKLKKHIREWALDPNGWMLPNSKKIYNLDDVEENEHKYFDSIFYKERWINENGLEQRLIVTYSPKYKNYQREVRFGQICRAVKMVEKGRIDSKNPNSPSRMIKKSHVTPDGEIANKVNLDINTELIQDEEMYDGFYAVCTTLEDSVESIVKINKQRWKIENMFRVLKSDFKTRPVYVRKEKRIEAHFLTCFFSLFVLKVLENQLDSKYSISEIIGVLNDMKVHKLDGIGYLPSYTPNDITDKLHSYVGFDTDFQFISDKNMKKILKASKKE